MITRAKSGIFCPKHPFGLSAIQTDSPNFEPRTFRQAAPLAHWQQAMHEELVALHKNGTWSLVPPPPRHNIVGS